MSAVVGIMDARIKTYRVQHNSQSVTIKMSRYEAKLILRFLNFVEQRRGVLLGSPTDPLASSDLGDTPRVLETVLSKMEET